MTVHRIEGDQGVTAVVSAGGTGRSWPVWEIVRYLDHFADADELNIAPGHVEEQTISAVAAFYTEEEVLAVARQFLRELEPRAIATALRYVAMSAGRSGWPSLDVFHHFGGFTKVMAKARRQARSASN